MESDRVERKASLNDRNRIKQAICAFANDLPDHRQPGVIFVGVNDDGTCSRLPITEDCGTQLSPAGDPHRLATLKPYWSLMPLALDARKPMFFLKPADGAVGSHMAAVQDSYHDFRRLATEIASRCDLALPVMMY